VGRHIFDFVDANHHEKVTTHLQAMLQGRKIGPVEYQLIKQDGTRFFSEINREILRSKDGTPNQHLFHRTRHYRTQADGRS